MAKTTINTGVAGIPVHARTSGGTGSAQAFVLVLDGSDSPVGADTSFGLDVDVTRLPTVTTRHAGSASAQTSVASTTTQNTTLIAADANRVGATIYNDSTAVLWILLGAGTESATVYTVQIAAGGYYEVPEAFVTLRVSGHWATANGSARITAAT